MAKELELLQSARDFELSKQTVTVLDSNSLESVDEGHLCFLCSKTANLKAETAGFAMYACENCLSSDARILDFKIMHEITRNLVRECHHIGVGIGNVIADATAFSKENFSK